MRNFYNLVIDVLDNYDVEDMSTHVEYIEEDDQYCVVLTHSRFTAVFRSYIDRFPVVTCVRFDHHGDDQFYSDDSDLVSQIQSDLIDEMYA
jgi:hypothetical protein